MGSENILWANISHVDLRWSHSLMMPRVASSMKRWDVWAPISIPNDAQVDSNEPKVLVTTVLGIFSSALRIWWCSFCGLILKDYSTREVVGKAVYVCNGVAIKDSCLVESTTVTERSSIIVWIRDHIQKWGREAREWKNYIEVHHALEFLLRRGTLPGVQTKWVLKHWVASGG